MLDLYAIKLKNFAKVKEAELLSEALVKEFFPISSEAPFRLPVVLRLRGTNFEKATNVILNGHQLQFSKTYEKGSNNLALLAMVPEHLFTQKFTSIYVLVDSMNFSQSSIYEWEFGTTPKVMSSAGKCVTQFVKVLLTTPGSDVFEPECGAGLQQFPGTKVSDPTGLLAAITVKVVSAVGYIRSKNAKLSHIPNDEKLDNAEIISLNFDPGDPGSVQLVLNIRTLGAGNLPVQLMLGAEDLVQELAGTQNVTPSSGTSTGY